MILLTDRPDKAQELMQLMWTLEPCIIATPGGTADARGHSIILSDLSLSSAEEIESARKTLSLLVCKRRIPILHLSRKDRSEAVIQAQTIKASAFLPRTASQAHVMAAVVELMQADRNERQGLQARERTLVSSKIGEAAFALKTLFDASRRGVPIDPEDLDKGTFAIIAAVAGSRAKMWLEVVRGHDDVTYQHCLLVTSLVAALSATLGMTAKSQRQIVTAALLHDIGKTRIPLAILNKKGRLSDQEMSVMVRHPTIGCDILSRQGLQDPYILDVVRHHHEFLDGSGYPDRLRGDAISAPVRIVTICDIYSALIERRPYKEPMSTTEAVDNLSRMHSRIDMGILASFISHVEG